MPAEKRDDLIFVTDGFTEPLLKSRGVGGEKQTQCVIYITVNEYGVGFDQRVSLGPVGAQGLPEYAAESELGGSGCRHCGVVFYPDHTLDSQQR